MFLDTTGLLALIDAREPQHRKACVEYDRARTRIIHGYVLAEFVALANVRGVAPEAALQFLMALLANSEITNIWPEESLTSQGIVLLLARQGRGYSLCVAVSFVLMRARNEIDALSTDQHFDEEGFRNGRPAHPPLRRSAR